jgi:glycosyltransferase involved in cell wall biosynthesis
VLRHEPFGLVGVEALAHQRPIIAFGGGGSDEWLAHGISGIRVEIRTAAAFSKALRQALTDQPLRLSLQQGTRARYSPFQPQAYLQRLLASFDLARSSFPSRS